MLQLHSFLDGGSRMGDGVTLMHQRRFLGMNYILCHVCLISTCLIFLHHGILIIPGLHDIENR